MKINEKNVGKSIFPRIFQCFNEKMVGKSMKHQTIHIVLMQKSLLLYGNELSITSNVMLQK